jgi:hypothetical protein
MNEEWTFAQSDPAEELARVHEFSVKKRQDDGRQVEFRITVKEYARPQEDQTLRFFAETDKQTNQSTVPFTPCGWGHTLLKALSECIKAIDRFPYEGKGSS